MSEIFANYPSLRGRTVFVTGGASGIGASAVAHFAEQAAKVAFVDINDEAGAALAQFLVGARGRSPGTILSTLRPEATSRTLLRRAIRAAGEKLGPITVLVNNAANDQRHKWEDVTVEFWDERMADQSTPPVFRVAGRGADDAHEAGGGSIINFGSISWHTNHGDMPAYTTAKAAIEGLTKGMARDLGAYKIRVNTVIPGWVMTQRQIELWLTPAWRKRTSAERAMPEGEGVPSRSRAHGVMAGVRR